MVMGVVGRNVFAEYPITEEITISFIWGKPKITNICFGNENFDLIEIHIRRIFFFFLNLKPHMKWVFSTLLWGSIIEIGDGSHANANCYNSRFSQVLEWSRFQMANIRKQATSAFILGRVCGARCPVCPFDENFSTYSLLILIERSDSHKCAPAKKNLKNWTASPAKTHVKL